MNTILGKDARLVPALVLAGIVLACLQNPISWAWFGAIVGIAGMLEVSEALDKRGTVERAAVAFTSVFVGGLVIMSYLGFEKSNRPGILLVIASVVVADIAALAVGRSFKNVSHRLPSPLENKSWEGIAGGLVFGWLTLIVADIWLEAFSKAELETAEQIWVGQAPVLAMVADLTSSRLKRSLGVKDWGWILRGHGGVTDRFISWAMAFAVVGWVV